MPGRVRSRAPKSPISSVSRTCRPSLGIADLFGARVAKCGARKMLWYRRTQTVKTKSITDLRSEGGVWILCSIFLADIRAAPDIW
jgi:hypothetical protein